MRALVGVRTVVAFVVVLLGSAATATVTAAATTAAWACCSPSPLSSLSQRWSPLSAASFPSGTSSLAMTTTTTTTTLFPVPNNLIPPERYESLIQWLRSRGAHVSDSVQIVPSSPDGGSGYGVVLAEAGTGAAGAAAAAKGAGGPDSHCDDAAVAAAEEGELLFSIPRRACLTLGDALNDRDCGSALRDLMDKAGPGGNTVAMAGFMAKEYLVRTATKEAKRKENSSVEDVKDDDGFGPYLDTLPWERGCNGQEHVLFWSDHDVETNLRGTLCYEETIALRSEVALAIKVINRIIGPSVRAARGDLNTDPPSFPLSLFSWPWNNDSSSKTTASAETLVDGVDGAVRGAFVSLLTRSFQDSDMDGALINSNSEKLVPLLDMLQHGAVPNVGHVMRKGIKSNTAKDNDEDDVVEAGTVQVRAKRTLLVGEELLNQYRAEDEETMPPHRFFSRFGFVPAARSMRNYSLSYNSSSDTTVQDVSQMLKDPKSIFYPQQAEV